MPMTSLQFLEVADWLPEPLLLVQPDGVLLSANRAAMRALGLSDEHLRHSTLQERCEDAPDAVLQYLVQCSRSREPSPGRLTLRRADGESIRYRASAGVFRAANDGQPTRLLVRLQAQASAQRAFHALNERIEQLSREIERRQKAETARQRLETQLLQAQKLESLGVLAGGIAHDFNNILTGIIGYCDLASLEVPDDSDARQFIAEAISGARQAAELTQQLLAYSGKGKFTVGPVTISALVERITRLLDVSISKRCVLRLDLMPNQPPCLADASQLRQVVMNLLINASDAIGDNSGAISVTTGAAWCDREYLDTAFVGEGLREGLYVTLEVSDTGSGMTPETQARIFDPFFTTKFTGRGLGLAAVLGIVRGHGGAIRVYSELGRGTTFKVLVPAAPDQELPATPAIASTSTTISGLVIVADDEERIRALARHMLGRMGCEVLLAADGREALTVYEAHQARDPLVLLDMTMPHLDGAGTLRELRRLAPSARVVLMSGYSEHTAMSQFIGKGLLGFLQKPFLYDDLLRAVSDASRLDRTGLL